MELLLKRIIVMIVTVSVAVPSIYFTLSFYGASQYEKNPANYIPSDSIMATRVSTGTGVFYVFIENSSIGIMTPVSVFLLPQVLQDPGSLGNLTLNATLTYYEEYRGVSVFEISGVNAALLLQDFFNDSTIVQTILNSTLADLALSNITFYIASPQNTFSIIGSVQILENSIDAYAAHMDFSSVRKVTFNSSANVSMYLYPEQELGVEHVSLNLSYNQSELFVSFSSLNSTTLLYLSTLAVRYGLQVYLHENSLELIAGKGIWPLLQFIQERGGLESIASQISTI